MLNNFTISTKWITLNTTYDLWHQKIMILVWYRHKNVVGLNQLTGSHPSSLDNWISNANTCMQMIQNMHRLAPIKKDHILNHKDEWQHDHGQYVYNSRSMLVVHRLLARKVKSVGTTSNWISTFNISFNIT